jgi:hypothetical protein
MDVITYALLNKKVSDISSEVERIIPHEETITSSGSVSQELEAGKIYDFTGELTDLTITLGESDSPAQYHFSFISGATPVVLTLPNDVIMPDDFSVEANTRYEIDILNGYGVVCAWAISGG